jgi:lysophospholipase L1-like esterase
MLGVLAFGDSITNGGGELQWGVALQSWALWVARALGLPFTSYATDGACAADVVALQLTEFDQRSAHPGARYDLGCLYIGVNDVRAVDWDREPFERDYRTALEFLAQRCARVLTLTAPLDLGRPRAGAKVRELNATIEAVARERRALVLDLRHFGARNLVMADHVHPTAFGQIAIAERALATLGEDGLQARARPSSLISYRPTRNDRLQSDTRYLYRHAKVSARAGLTHLRAALPPR